MFTRRCGGRRAARDAFTLFRPTRSQRRRPSAGLASRCPPMEVWRANLRPPRPALAPGYGREVNHGRCPETHPYPHLALIRPWPAHAQDIMTSATHSHVIAAHTTPAASLGAAECLTNEKSELKAGPDLWPRGDATRLPTWIGLAQALTSDFLVVAASSLHFASYLIHL